MNKAAQITALLIVLVVLSSSIFKREQLPQNKRVSELLVELGEKPADHHVSEIDPAKVKMGMEISTQGFTTAPDGSTSLKVSEFFVCTDCHNTVKEIGVATDNSPENRLAYAMEKDIPYLPGSTFWGMMNRTSWFNDDHIKKYGDLVKDANHDLKKSIQLCSRECSSGRYMEDWEMEATLHYLASIEITVADLNLGKKETLMIQNKEEGAAEMLRGKYLQKYPAKFLDFLPVEQRGLGTKGDAEKGKFIYEKSCMHCHKKDGVTKTVFGDGKKEKDFEWLLSYFEKSNGGSIYWICRKGTAPKKKTRMYMPIYSEEKLPDSQIEDLAIYILQEAKKKK